MVVSNEPNLFFHTFRPKSDGYLEKFISTEKYEIKFYREVEEQLLIFAISKTTDIPSE